MARVLVDPRPVKRLPHLQLFFDGDAKGFELYDKREHRALSLLEVHDLLDVANLREMCTSMLVMPAEYRDPLLASLADAHPHPNDGIVQVLARVKALLCASH